MLLILMFLCLTALYEKQDLSVLILIEIMTMHSQCDPCHSDRRCEIYTGFLFLVHVSHKMVRSVHFNFIRVTSNIKKKITPSFSTS